MSREFGVVQAGETGLFALYLAVSFHPNVPPNGLKFVGSKEDSLIRAQKMTLAGFEHLIPKNSQAIYG